MCDQIAHALAVLQDNRFLIRGKRSFERQFAQLYFSRLMLLRPVVEQQVRQQWPGVKGVLLL